MTCKPMDPDGTTNTSLHGESNSGLGKAILSVHGKAGGSRGRASSFMDDSSSAVSVAVSRSFSESVMEDESEGDMTSASDYTEDRSEISHFSSESAATEPGRIRRGGEVDSSSLLLMEAGRHEARPTQRRRRVKRKKKKPTTTSTRPTVGGAGSTTATNNVDKSNQEDKSTMVTKPRKKKPPAVKRTNTKTGLHEEFNTSKVNSGLSMEDFMTDSQTEGETDNNNTRPGGGGGSNNGGKIARRKKKVRRSVSYDPSINSSKSSLMMMADNSKNSHRSCRSRGGTDTEADTDNKSLRRRRRSSAVSQKKSTIAAASDAEQGTTGMENGSGTNAKPITSKATNNNLVTTENNGAKNKRSGVPKTKDTKAANEERSFAEESILDNSFHAESLSPIRPPTDAVKAKFARLEQSTASIEKDASLDLAKHDAAEGVTSKDVGVVVGGHRKREMMDAISKNIPLDVLPSTAADVKKEKTVQQKATTTKDTDTTAAAAAATTATKGSGSSDLSNNNTARTKATRPRRMKSHDGTTEVPRKPIRRTKSDGGPDPDDTVVTKPRTRTASKSRRTPSVRGNSSIGSNVGGGGRTMKQRSQSLDMVASHASMGKMNNRSARRRNNKNNSSMDQSVQSMPTIDGASSEITTRNAQRRMHNNSSNNIDQSIQSMPAVDGTSSGTIRRKPIQRSKSDGGPEPGADDVVSIRRARTPSKNQTKARGNNKNNNNNSNTGKTAKQRSQSLQMVAAQSSMSKISHNARRRRVHASETSPGGTSKVSVSVSLNTMDQSVQSMPTNLPRKGLPLATTGPPLGTKANTGIKPTATNTSPTTKDPVKRSAMQKKKPCSTNKQGTKPTKQTATMTASTKKTNRAESELDEDDSIVSMDESQAESQLTGLIAKDSTGRNNLQLKAVPSVPGKKKANGPISPFSVRANAEDDESGSDDGGGDGDDVHSTPAKSSWTKTKASESSATAPPPSRNGLSKAPPKRMSSGAPDHLISSYFGREDKTDAKVMAKAGESFSGSMAGSLLTDYATPASSSDKERITISPFSAHAASRHSVPTLLASEHTQQTPLIPDSDDEESGSFHLASPKPATLASQVMDEGPPPTPVVAPPVAKETAVASIDLPIEIPETPQPPRKAKQQPQIVLPVSTPIAKKESSNKVLDKKDDEEFADPVPKKEVVVSKGKSSFWEILCCRSADAVVT